MSTFSANVSATSAEQALEKVAKRLPEGFRLTGETQCKSERHMLWTVRVENLGGNRNDCWVVLTSYGISPSPDLGSMWEATLGASA